ncbi:MAG: cation:proton antiporter, partial [Planctomycetota bacterium]|nr:cation:proton antiporter [Planctomycetota bacterium]
MDGGIVPILVILTLGAACCVWLMGRLGLSPVIGYLLFGVAIGPFGKALLPEEGSVQALSDIGVILLMFFIGLEFRLSEMRAMLKGCIVGGGIQIAATAAPVGALAWHLGLSPAGAAVVGLMVAFSSTAIVMKAYSDRGETDSQHGRMTLAVQLAQDIVAIAAVALLPFLASWKGVAAGMEGGGDGFPDGAVRTAAAVRSPEWWRVILPFAALPVLFIGSRRLLPVLFRAAAAARAPEAFSLLSLGACLSVAMLAGAAGASPALGAFLGGLVLCQTPFASQILADLSTLRNLALGFFFVTVGMTVDLKFAAEHAIWLIAALP